MVHNNTHDNYDGHEQSHVLRRLSRKSLWTAFIINAVFLIVEVIGGLLSNSLALLADAGHMLTDVAALALAIFVAHLAEQVPTPRRTYGLLRAEVIGAHDIFIGVNAIDYSGYPDCRPEFITAFERVANCATKEAVEGSPFTLHAPLIHMTKGEIIKAGVSMGVDYSLTSSCYDPGDDGIACGKCDSCILRKNGFQEAGIEDPVRYRE